MECNTVFIYGLKCPEKDIVRYIGKSKSPKRRYSQHLSNAKLGKPSNIHLYRWIAKLLRHGLKPELIIIEECFNSEWKEREKFWINEFGLSNLLNVSEGGNEPPDNTGYRWTEEQKLNHPSHLRKGKPQWVDTTHPMLGKEHPSKGQKRSKEFCELMKKQRLENNGMKGKKLSKEHLEKISKPIALIDKNGSIIKEYASIVEASRELALVRKSITKVCDKEYKQTKGYIFKYI